MSVKIFLSAKSDLRYAYAGSKSDDEYDLKLAEYHIQQCVEKCLKFALEECGIEYKKTHDLMVLLSQLPETQTILPEDVETYLFTYAPALTDWEAKTRYNESYIVAKKYVNAGLSIANSVVSCVEQYLDTRAEETFDLTQLDLGIK